MKPYAVYEITCITPNHRYVGYSGQVEKRLGVHLLGQGAVFTQKHGVSGAYIVSWHDTAEEAKLAEQAHYRKIKSLGYVTRM